MAGRICRLAQQEGKQRRGAHHGPRPRSVKQQANGKLDLARRWASQADRSEVGRGQCVAERCGALLDLKQRGCRGSRAVMVLTATGSGRRGPWRDAGAGTGQRRGAATLARSLEPDEADAMARGLARGQRIQAAECPARTWQWRFLAAETTERERAVRGTIR